MNTRPGHHRSRQATALTAASHPHTETTPSKRVVRAEPKSQLDGLKVTGLITSSSGLKVILHAGTDSRIMAVGDSVGDLRVLDIDNSSVTLIYRGEERRLPLQH